VQTGDEAVVAAAGEAEALTGAVHLRSLVPSERELGKGATVDERAFVHADAGGAEPPSRRWNVGSLFVTFLRDLNPRTIEGPLLPLIVLGLVALVRAWDDIVIGVVIPEMRADFAYDITFIATAQTGAFFVGDLIGPLLGHLADRVKRVWFIRVGSIVTHLAALLVGVAGSLGGLVGARVISVVGSTIIEPAQGPLTADYFPLRSRVRAFVFIGAFSILGISVVFVGVGVAATFLPWRTTVLVFGGLALLASTSTFFLREPERGRLDRLDGGLTEEQADAAGSPPPPTFAEAFRVGYGIKTLRRMWFATMFMPATLFGQIYVGIYLATQGFDALDRGLAFGAAGIVGFLFLPVAGAVGAQLVNVNPSRVMTLYGSVFFVQAASLTVIGFSNSPKLAVVMLMPFMAATAFLIPAATVVTSLIIPPNMRGIGMSTDRPFRLLSRLFFLLLLQITGVFASLTATAEQAIILMMAVPTFAAGAIIASGSKTIAGDIRAARASVLAGLASKESRQRGRNKMLICRDVDVSYDGVQVLFGVDLDIEEGEIVALLGTNGAGKSTLMRAICGLQRAANGAIFLDGIDITQEPPHLNARRGIVMVPGGHAIFPTLSVEDNLQTAAWINSADETYVRDRTEEVLELFPVLRTRLHEAAGNMSGGEQQMLAIGQALLMKPRLLMIDELSLGLAPAVVEVLLDTLRRIHADGTTIVLIEQSLNVALTIAERAVFMEKGEVRFDGATAELMVRPELIRAVFMGGAATGAPLARTAAHTRGETREPLLRVDDVAVAFGGVRALTGATLEVGPEEIVGIIGPNGAGKTTLFDVISGFVRPDSGAVVLGGVDVTAFVPEARAKLGLGRSFQNARLFPSLTVRENIAVAMERVVKVKNPLLTAMWTPKARQNERQIGRRVDGLIDILGLGAYADKFVNELSTGTRRSVDIACIMASAPKMLLLDEPSSGLAQAETEALGPVLERVARDAGCGMLVIEHDIGLVSSISHRLYAMELGAVVTSGPPDEVVRDERVVSSYLAATEDVLVRSDLNRLMVGGGAVAVTREAEERRSGHGN
jgi:ABC-type branched-subunit amino acid transport system ATPase component/MFS family permease